MQNNVRDTLNATADVIMYYIRKLLLNHCDDIKRTSCSEMRDEAGQFVLFHCIIWVE